MKVDDKFTRQVVLSEQGLTTMEYILSEEQKAKNARDSYRERVFEDIFTFVKEKYPYDTLKVTIHFEESHWFEAWHDAADRPSESGEDGRAS